MVLPLVFKGKGMSCLLIGGGEVAWHKLELLLAAGCAVTVIAPQIHDCIRSEIGVQGMRWIERGFHGGDCRGYHLVIAATGRREINREVSEEAQSLGIPVNVVDDPELCTVIFPAVWRQGPLTISVSTDGTAPFMAAAVRDNLVSQGNALVPWVEAAAEFRVLVRSEISDPSEKHRLYRRFVDVMRSGRALELPEGRKLGDWIAWLDKNVREST
jgi:uroporphyrin-III C-methyltransferase/precorrin-2 dehydrogenase/sirohydrochlorin ferrochelatase